MNKLSTSFLAMMLLVVISACSAPEATTTVTPATPPPVVAPTPAAKPTPTPVTTTETQTTTEKTSTQSSTSSAVIADGTYTTKGSYRSPAQTEDVEFTFTMKAGAVEGVELVKESSIPMSKKYQGLFMEGIKKEIIGKKLSEIGTFDRVNGSSLTPKGFNQAMTELKQKA